MINKIFINYRQHRFLYLRIECRPSFVGGNAIDESVRFRFPRRRFFDTVGRHFIVEERKGFLAGKCRAGKERTVAHRKFDFNVQLIGSTATDERSPQPIVHILVGHVTDDITAPVDSLLKIGKTFFDPLSVWER